MGLLNPYTETDRYFMQSALHEAERAKDLGEIPIGAVVVLNHEIIGRGFNRTIIDHDPSAHAEILALREAGKALGNHRLLQAKLYVTLEPCLMCLGASVQARISDLVFGAYDSRVGTCGSEWDLARHPKLNHRIHRLQGGVLEEECKALLQDFFRAKRKEQR
ncbi:MAG: tRNA adenosine(34) deaminase TadA [Cardiobacteriaceae bacterium]|nr:tRNA adenosine(34) deaminase TadA [Cardiobacteriaceae bacterium]